MWARGWAVDERGGLSSWLVSSDSIPVGDWVRGCPFYTKPLIGARTIVLWCEA